jgi:DNA-binding response OmpR family regulator
MQAKLLIVEDEEGLRSSLRDYFAQEGFEVAVVEDGRKALDAFDESTPDLLIADVQLPHMDGLELCQAVRQRVGHAVGVIMISGVKKETLDRIVGLEVGADVYMTKPFETRELLAQSRSLLRRIKAQDTGAAPGGWLVIDDHLRIHFERRLVKAGGEEVHLSRLEFDLLKYLAERPGVPCARADLLDAVWGYEHGLDVSESAVNTRIRRLREKIEPDPSNPRYIQSMHGVGYCFKAL